MLVFSFLILVYFLIVRSIKNSDFVEGHLDFIVC